MKKQLLSIALGLIAMLSVTTSFAATKKDAKDAKSYTTDRGTIVVDGNKTSVLNKKGQLVYSISRFTADNLPKNIFDIVRNGYESFYVSGMEKVEQPGIAPVYFVHLEDKTSIKTVKVNVSDGETELVQDFTRG